MLAAREHEGTGLDAQWLFRQGDLVLGPIAGHQVVEKLYTGELTADTPVSPAGGSGFQRLGEFSDFRLHASKSVVKARVEAQARAEQARRSRERLVFAGVVAAMTGVLSLGAWLGARHVAVYGLGDPEGSEDIRVELPTLTPARANPRLAAELFEYSVNPKKGPERPPPSALAPDKPEPDKPEPTKPGAVASARPGDRRNPTPPEGGATSRPKPKPAEPDGLETLVNYDQAAINRVVKKHQSSLFRCFREETERRPGFAAKVPIEFIIGNDGRVSRLWVDHPQLKKGPLYDCLFEELRKWPFPSYQGEQATVGLSFSIGKKG
jgi:hypothetical protein